MGVNAKYAYVALQRAIEHSGMKPSDYEENPRCASILGQGGTSIPDIVETVTAVTSGAPRWKNKVGPFRVTRSMGSTVSAVLSTAFKLQGPSYSISSACSTGAHCIGTGMEQIMLGKADVAFCGAGEAEDWGFTSMFDCMGALSTGRNDDPTKASRCASEAKRSEEKREHTSKTSKLTIIFHSIRRLAPSSLGAGRSIRPVTVSLLLEVGEL